MHAQRIATIAAFALGALVLATTMTWAATGEEAWGWVAVGLWVANVAVMAWLFAQPLPRRMQNVRADPRRPE
jgi:hypothetical protein